MAAALGLYLHIPFCARRCDYCDFFVTVGQEGVERFFAELARDLDREAAGLGPPAPGVDSIYFGGGTPSYVEPAWIARMLEAIAAKVAIVPGAEITLEANPESVTPDRARAWRGAGVNRLSLGVQSFDDAVLSPRGRLYTSGQAVQACETARQAGFENLNLDLIAGLPGETVAGFSRGLRRLAGLRPEHVSVYLIETAESGKLTPLSRAVQEGRAGLACEQDQVAMYASAASLLAESGYDHYEISNFARAGRRCRHNLKYWLSSAWLGLGPSAHSYLAGRRTSRPADLARWASGERLDHTLADPTGRAAEALVMQLRLLEGVDLDDFSRRWDYDPRDRIAGALAELSEAGVVALEGSILRLTASGLLLSNEVFGRIA